LRAHLGSVLRHHDEPSDLLRAWRHQEWLADIEIERRTGYSWLGPYATVKHYRISSVEVEDRPLYLGLIAARRADASVMLRERRGVVGARVVFDRDCPAYGTTWRAAIAGASGRGSRLLGRGAACRAGGERSRSHTHCRHRGLGATAGSVYVNAEFELRLQQPILRVRSSISSAARSHGRRRRSGWIVHDVGRMSCDHAAMGGLAARASDGSRA
jgi:hypothetical protein